MFELYSEYYNADGEIVSKATTLPFVYLHGNLEKYNGFDLVDYDGEKPSAGIYETFINIRGEKHPAILYIWLPAEHKGFTTAFYKGLVVSPTDTEAVEYAQRCFDDKVMVL